MSDFATEKDLDRAAQAAIRSGASKSIAVLEKAFIRNGSGRYFVLRTTDFDPVQRVNELKPADELSAAQLAAALALVAAQT